MPERFFAVIFFVASKVLQSVFALRDYSACTVTNIASENFCHYSLYGHGDATTLAGAVKYRQGSSYVPAPEFSDSLAVWGTIWADPKISNIGYGEIEEMLDPPPFTSGPAYQDLAALPSDGFFERVVFKGAFGATNWLRGWTALDEYGYLGELNNQGIPVVTVRRLSPRSSGRYWKCSMPKRTFAGRRRLTTLKNCVGSTHTWIRCAPNRPGQLSIRRPMRRSECARYDPAQGG